jgi:P-type Mg2+ transporter
MSILLTAFTNPFNFILIGLAIVSIATGDKATFTVMIIMVILSTGLRSVLSASF